MLPLEQEKNCNAQELLAAVQVLIDFGQWNAILRLQAGDNPAMFIDSVQKHATSLETAIQNKRGNFSLILTGYNIQNKISAIKAFRSVFVCGLADAKSAVEGLESNGFVIATAMQFTTQNDAMESNVAKELSLGGITVEAVVSKTIISMHPDAVVWRTGSSQPILIKDYNFTT